MSPRADLLCGEFADDYCGVLLGTGTCDLGCSQGQGKGSGGQINDTKRGVGGREVIRVLE